MKAAKTWLRVAEDYKRLPVNRRGPGRALEPEQEVLLFETAAFLGALLASNTTCRGFELRHLRLENVDLVDRKLIIGKSKTDAGYREIPLNSAALCGCAKLLERANALGSIEPDHYLFSWVQIQAHEGNEARHRIRSAETAAGLAQRVAIVEDRSCQACSGRNRR
jgi:integrase